MKFNIVNNETGMKDGAYGNEALAKSCMATLQGRYPCLTWEVVAVPDTGWPRDFEFHAIPENAELLGKLTTPTPGSTSLSREVLRFFSMNLKYRARRCAALFDMANIAAKIAKDDDSDYGQRAAHRPPN